MMQEIQCTGRVLPGGRLQIPPTALRQLRLRPNMSIKVTLQPTESTLEANERLTSERAAVWREVDALCEELSAKHFSLTESLLQTREEEDASQ